MEFRLLGPLEVCGDAGQPVELTQRLHRRLLAQLLLHANQPCARRELAEALWGDEPPAGPATALRTCVHGLRKALGEHGARLQTHPEGYLLRVIAGESDLPSFRAMAGQGRAALDRGEPAGAAELLARALDLWRDPPLADLPLTAERGRLLDRHRDAQEALMDARLALGRHHDTLPHLRRIVAADPLREHAWAQLMLALYRCGARADALSAFRTIRGLLSDRHGIDPGPELLELHGQILNDDPALAAPALAAPPGPADGQAGPWIPVCQLPAALPDFTGRGEEITSLLARLPGRGMAVTVVSGMPGAGKTALALHVAHLASPYFPHGQLYAPLGGCDRPRDPHEVLGELLRGLGVPPGGVPDSASERAARYRSLLAGRKILVIADGASTAAQVRPLLPGSAGSAVLVTSRARLADLDGAHQLPLGDLTVTEAVSLLTRIAGRDRILAEPEAARAIAGLCGGLPLAVRIAGARLASQPGLWLTDLAGMLADERRRLTELVIGDQSVRDRIASSERTLDERGRQALAQLTMRALAADTPVWLLPFEPDQPPGTDVGSQLADVGLLCLVSGRDATAVYRVHPLVRAYAAELAAPAAAPGQCRSPGAA